MTDPRDFYDALAPLYPLVYADWDASIARQGEALDGVIREALGDGPRAVLDVACGIGTQALGLALRGHRVTASDLSPAAVARLQDEAARRGVRVEASAADMRDANRVHAGPFDVVVCADNSLPHLLSDDEILRALRALRACTAPGGVCIVTLRDYAPDDLAGERIVPHGVRHRDSARWVVFQVWTPRPPLYDTTLYLLEERDGDTRTHRMPSATYYAVPVDRVAELMREAGFTDVRRMDGVFFQPLLVGRGGSRAREPHSAVGVSAGPEPA